MVRGEKSDGSAWLLSRQPSGESSAHTKFASFRKVLTPQ